MSHRHTRIAVALAGLAAFALAIVLPRWAVALIFGWLLLDALAVALLCRRGQQRERIRQSAAHRGGEVAFHSNLYSTIPERDNG